MLKKLVLGTLVAVVVVLVAALGYATLNRDSTNARVAEEIRQNPDGERAAKTMLITLSDGTLFPVNFLHEGNQVFMGIDGFWWREFVGEGQVVSMFIKGETYTGHAVAILDDPAFKKKIFNRLRPTVPKWLPDWLNGKLVKITLDEPPRTPHDSGGENE